MIKMCRDYKHCIIQPGFWDHLCKQGGLIRACETERDNACGEEGLFWEAKTEYSCA